MLKKGIGKVVDWSGIDKEDYLLAMERSPIRDIEIKHLLRAALTGQINDRQIYRKGIYHSYYYAYIKPRNCKRRLSCVSRGAAAAFIASSA